MLKKLRKKFIASNMFLVGIIIISVFAGLFFVLAKYERQQSYNSLSYALENCTSEEGIYVGKGHIDEHKKAAGEDFANQLRNVVMIIQTDKKGDITSVVTASNVSISEKLVKIIVSYTYLHNEDRGDIPDYTLRYLRVENANGGYRIGIADTSVEAQALAFVARVFILCTLLILSVMFLISDYMAHRAIAPVEKSWNNQNRFVADASHELKTPLTVILANMDIMADNPDSTVAEQQKWIENTKSEAKRMSQLVSDMLFLAKSDAAVEESYNFADVNFSILVSDCALTFESLAFEKGVKLESSVAPELYVRADEAKLKQTVIILIDNALKYVSEKGEINIELEQVGKNVRLKVRNTGTPIPPDKQKHIFERFFRAEESRARDKGGSGLGLSIASNIVGMHKGRLALDFSDGRGTQFSVTLGTKPSGLKKRK